MIQQRLGHSSIKTTLHRYGHVMEGLDEKAAEALDASWMPEARVPAASLAPEPVPAG